jgi:hypothetical protein
VSRSKRCLEPLFAHPVSEGPRIARLACSAEMVPDVFSSSGVWISVRFESSYQWHLHKAPVLLNTSCVPVSTPILFLFLYPCPDFAYGFAAGESHGSVAAGESFGEEREALCGAVVAEEFHGRGANVCLF